MRFKWASNIKDNARATTANIALFIDKSAVFYRFTYFSTIDIFAWIAYLGYYSSVL